MTKANGLYAKMASIMGRITGLKRDGRIKEGSLNYTFVTDTDVYMLVRELLVEHKLALFASMVDLVQERNVSQKTSNRGDSYEKVSFHTRAKFKFVLADSESGETVECLWWSEAEDSGDKGVNKAATAALKNWLLKTFIIPTGDDPDQFASPHDEDVTESKPEPAAKKRQSKPAPKSSAPYDPADDERTYNQDIHIGFTGWLAKEQVFGIENAPHATQAVLISLKHVGALTDEQTIADLYGAGLSVADVYSAMVQRYNDKQAAA